MRIYRHLLALLALSSMAACSASPMEPTSTDPTVYATEQGKKYHKKNCRLKTGSKGMLLSAAKKKGYKPCAVCKPPK